MTLEKLPDDLMQLKQLVMDNFQRAEQEELRAKSEHQRAELYKFKFENLARQHFGRSSEKLNDPPGQQLLFELPARPELPSPESQPDDAAKDAPPKKHGGGRKPLPKDLPRERIEYTLPESERKCSCCGECMQPFGEETSEQLEYIPASLKVIEHVRIKYACKACQEKPAIAPPPDKVIDKGMAGPGLMAWIAVSKFGDHQPLYRQENIFERLGIDIPRSTQCGWLGQVAELLEPLYKRMARQIILSSKVHTDDTPIALLDPGRGKTQTARFWVYVGDDSQPYTVFDFTPSRSRDGPEKFLKGFKGHLQADAFAGYDRMCAGKEVIEVACWAHARRKFFEAKDTDARAGETLALIGELYAVEAQARPQIEAARALPLELRGPALSDAFAVRRQLREAVSKAVLEKIDAWMKARAADTLPKSPLGLAIGYARNQWRALNRFIENGALEADNNAAENAVRPIALGRKNYLFVGSEHGGRRAAILYSLIRTCERHQVNAWEYLRDVLVRISTHPASRIGELMPHVWQPKTQPIELECKSNNP
jgi:transposase